MSVSRDVRQRAEDLAYQAITAALTVLAVVAILSLAVAVARLATGV